MPVSNDPLYVQIDQKPSPEASLRPKQKKDYTRGAVLCIIAIVVGIVFIRVSKEDSLIKENNIEINQSNKALLQQDMVGELAQ